jgi:hypothetical protein
LYIAVGGKGERILDYQWIVLIVGIKCTGYKYKYAVIGRYADIRKGCARNSIYIYFEWRSVIATNFYGRDNNRLAILIAYQEGFNCGAYRGKYCIEKNCISREIELG